MGTHSRRVGDSRVSVELFADGVLVNGRAEGCHVAREGREVCINIDERLSKAEVAQAMLDAMAFLHAEAVAAQNISVFVGPKLYVPVPLHPIHQ